MSTPSFTTQAREIVRHGYICARYLEDGAYNTPSKTKCICDFEYRVATLTSLHYQAIEEVLEGLNENKIAGRFTMGNGLTIMEAVPVDYVDAALAQVRQLRKEAPDVH